MRCQGTSNGSARTVAAEFRGRAAAASASATAKVTLQRAGPSPLDGGSIQAIASREARRRAAVGLAGAHARVERLEVVAVARDRTIVAGPPPKSMSSNSQPKTAP